MTFAYTQCGYLISADFQDRQANDCLSVCFDSNLIIDHEGVLSAYGQITKALTTVHRDYKNAYGLCIVLVRGQELSENRIVLL